MSEVIDRFVRYAGVDTQSSEESGLHPSTHKQKVLGHMLADGLEKIGASDVYTDEHNYVYAYIPATDGGASDKVLGFIAHMDTSPAMSGAGVKPRCIPDYDGRDVCLNREKNIVLSVRDFPELKSILEKN